jgi:hypothetical protein
MSGGHLCHESGLDLIPRLGAFDESQGGIHRRFGKTSPGSLAAMNNWLSDASMTTGETVPKAWLSLRPHSWA